MAEGADPPTQHCLDQIRKDLGVEPSSERSEVYLPVCYDPVEYLGILRDSSEYKRVVISRHEASLNLSRGMRQLYPDDPEPTVAEVAEVFEQGEAFKQLFWYLYENVLHLAYNPSFFSRQFQDLFEKYRVVAKASVLAAQSGNRDEIVEKDRIRSEGHDQTAMQLVKDSTVGSEFHARMLIRAFLVDIGEDFIASARVADQIRALRGLGSEKARTRYLSSVGETARIESFSPESIFAIQRQFINKHPDAICVPRLRYLTYQ